MFHGLAYSLVRFLPEILLVRSECKKTASAGNQKLGPLSGLVLFETQVGGGNSVRQRTGQLFLWPESAPPRGPLAEVRPSRQEAVLGPWRPA